ncbi:hypothetical protein JHK82_040408 [Glycine max]|uniref:Secreted protein n=2 Tax=Glycine subgen. Soja TaxID=1462606 RepID=A0A0R0GLM2_SOYBN|nr:hypothetical protein JHK87_040417 [Glycine soja]KAG4963732.1 hypothetical protein JHK86_040600 [Glycine max]KAG4966214.1 hypothetical protein JHK85_041189 [Glycine max]KAG5111185.1 hypothetical protein JHK82_040408 [Glycine max]KAG5122475.1 hypothetical protein JHK84_040815 [Glycine max]
MGSKALALSFCLSICCLSKWSEVKPQMGLLATGPLTIGHFPFSFHVPVTQIASVRTKRIRRALCREH